MPSPICELHQNDEADLEYICYDCLGAVEFLASNQRTEVS